MKKRDEKEFFRLWYEYARRHEVFREYVEHYLKAIESGNVRSFLWPKDTFRKTWARGVTKCIGLGFFDMAAREIPFDLWWKSNADKMRRWAGTVSSNQPVYDPGKLITRCLGLADLICKNKGIQPSTDELKKLLLEVSRSYLLIPLPSILSRDQLATL